MLALVLKRLFAKRTTEAIPHERAPLYAAVRDALLTVQQYAKSHGGEIELVDVTEAGEVMVRMKGMCRGCPLADITLKQGIEGQLKILVPGVVRVTRIS